MELFFYEKQQQKKHNNAIVILLTEKSTENGMEIYFKKCLERISFFFLNVFCFKNIFIYFVFFFYFLDKMLTMSKVDYKCANMDI